MSHAPGELHSTLCGCKEDIGGACCVCCCINLVLADNWFRSIGYPKLDLSCCQMCRYQFCPANTGCCACDRYCAPVIPGAAWTRHNIRTIRGQPIGEFSWYKDGCSHYCCWACTICQDRRELDLIDSIGGVQPLQVRGGPPTPYYGVVYPNAVVSAQVYNAPEGVPV